MQNKTFKYKKEYRIATFAIYSEDGNRITPIFEDGEPRFLSRKDAMDVLPLYKKEFGNGCYVTSTPRVFNRKVVLDLPIEFKHNKKFLDQINEGSVQSGGVCIFNINDLLGIRPDDKAIVLDDIPNPKVLKSLVDKASTKHRGKHGGLIDEDNTYQKGSFDDTAKYPLWGDIKFAESAEYNKGTTTLKKPKLSKVRAGAEFMPVTTNDQLSPLRLSQKITEHKSRGLNYVEAYRDIRKQFKNTRKEIIAELQVQYPR